MEFFSAESCEVDCCGVSLELTESVAFWEVADFVAFLEVDFSVAFWEVDVSVAFLEVVASSWGLSCLSVNKKKIVSLR